MRWFILWGKAKERRNSGFTGRCGGNYSELKLLFQKAG